MKFRIKNYGVFIAIFTIFVARNLSLEMNLIFLLILGALFIILLANEKKSSSNLSETVMNIIGGSIGIISCIVMLLQKYKINFRYDKFLICMIPILASCILIISVTQEYKKGNMYVFKKSMISTLLVMLILLGFVYLILTH